MREQALKSVQNDGYQSFKDHYKDVEQRVSRRVKQHKEDSAKIYNQTQEQINKSVDLTRNFES